MKGESKSHACLTEVSHWGEYDYVLINDDFDTCLSQLRAILKAERLRRSRRKAHLAEFVRDMLASHTH